MSGHGEFVEHVEAAKVETDPVKMIGMLIDGAKASVDSAHGWVRSHYGQTVHGVSVNQPLVDLYRELGEAERALANASNAMAVLEGTARPVGPPPTTRPVAGPPPKTRAPR